MAEKGRAEWTAREKRVWKGMGAEVSGARASRTPLRKPTGVPERVSLTGVVGAVVAQMQKEDENHLG